MSILDDVLLAGAITIVPTETSGQAVSIPWLLDERNTVVRHNNVYGLRVCSYHFLEKRRSVSLLHQRIQHD